MTRRPKSRPAIEIRDLEPKSEVRGGYTPYGTNPYDQPPPDQSIDLIAPIEMEKGVRYPIREEGRTVGAGTVTEVIQ